MRHDAEPVLEPNGLSYLQEMPGDVIKKPEEVITGKSLNGVNRSWLLKAN